MPKKTISKSINMTNKCEDWYIKTDSKLLIFWIFINTLLLDLFNYQFIITIILWKPFLYFWTCQKRNTIFNIWTSNICISKSGNIRTYNICLRKAGTTTNSSQKTQAYFPEQSQPPPILSSKYINNNISLDLNIASYYLNHLSYPDI